MGVATSNGRYFYVNGVRCTVDATGDASEIISERVTLEGGLEADVKIKCAWGDRLRLVRGLMGGVELKNGTQMDFTRPAKYPGYPRSVVTGISAIRGIKPRIGTDGWPNYEDAVLTANFRVPTWIQDEAYPPFTSITISSAPEVFAPPGGAYYMPDLQGSPVSESTIGIIRPHAEVTITREFLPYPPLDAVMYLEGTLNDAPLKISDRVFPRGCLMFIGFGEVEAMADPWTGYQTYRCSYKFMGNFEVEFNKYYGRDGEWHLINSKKDGSGLPPFDYEDFTWFFGNNLASPDPNMQGDGGDGFEFGFPALAG